MVNETDSVGPKRATQPPGRERRRHRLAQKFTEGCKERNLGIKG